MSDFVNRLRGDDELELEVALGLCGVLVPVLEAAPDDDEAQDVTSRVISRMPRDELAAIILDWWYVVTTGGQPPLGWAYTLPEQISGPLRDAMAATVELGHTDPPVSVARWVAERRRLSKLIPTLDRILDLDAYGKSKLPGERAAWSWLVDELESVTGALRSGRETEAYTFDRKGFEKELDGAGVKPNSRRWNEMIKRANECVGGINAIVEVGSTVEPWRRRPEPPLIDEIPDDVAAALGELAPAVLGAVLPAPGDGSAQADREIWWRQRSEAIADELTTVADALDEAALSWLATVVDGWLARADVRVPPLERVVAVRHELEARLDALGDAGVDVIEARVLLLDHDVTGARAAVDRIDEDRRHDRRAGALDSKLGQLHERVQSSENVPERWDEQMAEARASLGRGDLDTAARLVGVLELDLRGATRSEEIAALSTVRAQLDHHAAAVSLLDELDRHLAALDADREVQVDSDLRRRSSERLDALEDQRRAEADDLVVRIKDLLETQGDLIPDAEYHNFELALNDVEQHIAGGRTMDARALGIDLLDAVEGQRVHRWSRTQGESALVDHLVGYCTQELSFADDDVRRFYVAAKTKPFVILAGLTGSGKSTIARLFAGALGADSRNGRFRRIAVRPDWIDQSEVLGLLNPVSNRFEPGWLALVARQCERNLDQLHVILLDEMNLAPVEQYLAEYLSALEEARSGADVTMLPLYSEGANPDNASEWPAAILFPRNLLVVGTVNVDETTRVLSERVLDRANVLQLSVALSDAHHRDQQTVVAPWFVPFSEWEGLCTIEPDPGYHDDLIEIATVLQSVGIGVGARAHIEVERFIANAERVMTGVAALDLAILQRIIPKIRGFKRDLIDGIHDLEEILTDLGCERAARVLAHWLDEAVPDDDFIDGTDARIGLIR